MSSITHKVDDREYLLIPIPPGESQSFCCHSPAGNYIISYYSNKAIEADIPHGNYSIIGRASDLTESQCSEMVEEANPELIDMPGVCHFKDYTSANWEDDFGTARESLDSLLSSYSLKGETTLCLLKQK